MGTIGVEELSSAIAKELTLYSSEVTEGIKRETKTHAKKLLDITRKTAPSGDRKTGKYRTSIRCTVQSETANRVTYLWYVTGKNYRLTHLLVKGHAKRGGGRTKANPFLQNAVDQVIPEYERACEEVVKNG